MTSMPGIFTSFSIFFFKRGYARIDLASIDDQMGGRSLWAYPYEHLMIHWNFAWGTCSFLDLKRPPRKIPNTAFRKGLKKMFFSGKGRESSFFFGATFLFLVLKKVRNRMFFRKVKLMIQGQRSDPSFLACLS